MHFYREQTGLRLKLLEDFLIFVLYPNKHGGATYEKWLGIAQK